jgi:hypothetical protein
MPETNGKELLAEILRRGLLLPGEVLFLSGSLVENLGNRLSDVDAYVISERALAGQFGRRTNAFEFNGLMVDLQPVRKSEVDELVERLDSLPRQAPLVSRRFNFTEWQFLQRLSIGQALAGERTFAAVQQRVTNQSLARFKLEWATEWITRLQIDLAGLRAALDWQSMLFLAQQVLGYAIDCLLAAHGLTNPSPRWRVRLLHRLPSDWESVLPGRHHGLSAADRYLTLSQTPATLDANSVYAYALRALSFSRVVVPWAEWRLRSDTPCTSPMSYLGVQHEVHGGSRLPCLALDVQIRHDGGRFLLSRIDAPRLLLPISATLASILSLHDGETLSTAVDQVIATSGEPSIRRGDVEALLDHWQLVAPPFAVTPAPRQAFYV